MPEIQASGSVVKAEDFENDGFVYFLLEENSICTISKSRKKFAT